MALIRSGSVGTESPYLQYELYADQTGGSVNNRTIKITLKAKLSSGYYGYPANWRANINGTWSGWMRLKGTERWNKNDGFRTFEYSTTTDVGTTSSKAITVGFGIDSYNGDDSWDSTTTGSFTVGATNRPPNPPSNIIVRNGSSANSPVLSAGIVPENITTLYITWSAGSDPDGDQLTYALNESINNGGYVQRDFGTDLAHSYNTNGWDEGGTIQFYVDAKDTKGAWSSKTYSGVLTKNRLTAGTIYEYSNNINFNTKSFEARFRGGSNTDKSAVTYSCYSDSITIYNQTYTSDTKQTILIWRTGDATPASNQPYIKFNELVELYRSNNFTGTLSMGLFSKNIHGTKKSTVAAVVQVDLRVAPVAPSSVSITGGKAKKTIAGSTVYLPNGTDDITFSWTASTNPLNAPFSYDLYEVYNGEATKIATVGSNSTSYSYVRPPQLNDIASLAFKVVAITSYGYSSEKTSNQIRLEYYNPPTISVGEISRKDTSASVNVLIKINTSIPSVQGTGTWECSNNQKGNITTSSNNINITNLKSDSTYSLIILYNDNSGLSTSRRESISIGKNLPIFSINKFGVGVNGYEANSSYSLFTKGSGYLDGLRIKSNSGLDDCNTYKTEEFWINRTNGKSLNRPTNYATVFNIGSDNSTNFQLACSYTAYPGFWVRGRHDTTGNYHDWAQVYTTLNKPTAADVGLSNVQNRAFNWSWGSSIPTHVWGSQGDSTNQYVYKVSTHGDRFNCFPFVGTDGVMETGKYIDFHGSSDSTGDFQTRLTSVSNAEFNISAENLTLANNNNTWKSLDLMRNGCLARFGIGSDGTGADANCATVETWNSGASGYTTRLEVGANKLRYIKNIGGSPALNVWVDSGAHGGIAIGSSSTTYLKWLRGTAQLQVRNYDDNAYTQIVASSFTNGSRREYKQDIDDIDASIVKDIVMNNHIKTYHLKEEVKEMESLEAEAQALGFELEEEMTTPNTRAGLILEDLTPEADDLLHPERTDGIDTYAMVSVLWRFCQEQQKAIDRLEQENKEIKEKLGL